MPRLLNGTVATDFGEVVLRAYDLLRTSVGSIYFVDYDIILPQSYCIIVYLLIDLPFQYDGAKDLARRIVLSTPFQTLPDQNFLGASSRKHLKIFPSGRRGCPHLPDILSSLNE